MRAVLKNRCSFGPFLIAHQHEEEAASIKGSRYALVKNPEDLTDGQRARLEALKKRAGSRLVRAWELKEDLRAVFRAADGVPSRFLRTFRQPPRPAVRCGYPSSRVTSR